MTRKPRVAQIQTATGIKVNVGQAQNSTLLNHQWKGPIFTDQSFGRPLEVASTLYERESQFWASIRLRGRCCTLLDPLQHSDDLCNRCKTHFFHHPMFFLTSAYFPQRATGKYVTESYRKTSTISALQILLGTQLFHWLEVSWTSLTTNQSDIRWSFLSHFCFRYSMCFIT